MDRLYLCKFYPSMIHITQSFRLLLALWLALWLKLRKMKKFFLHHGRRSAMIGLNPPLEAGFFMPVFNRRGGKKVRRMP